MDKITIILNEGPDTMRSWNGLRVAGALLDVSLEVEAVLFDEAVICAKKGQNPPEDLKGLKKKEVIEGAQVCCLMDVANAIKSSKQTLVF